MRTSRVLVPVALLSLLAVHAPGQTLLHEFQTDAAVTSLAAGADWDDDGRPDLLLRVVEWGSGAARIEARSSADATLLWEHAQPQAGNDYGAGLCVIDDVDGDGVPDVAVGAPRHDAGGAADIGRVWLRSGVDGTAILHVTGSAAGARFGAALVAAGDQDGDGLGDVLVGSPWADDGLGRVTLLSGTGAVLAARTGPEPNESFVSGFGDVLASVGDLTGDGRVELAVADPSFDGPGFPDDRDVGRVVVFTGPELTRLAELTGDADEQQLGRDVTGLGDYDLDGVPDLAVLDADHVRVVSGAGFASLLELEVFTTDVLSGVGDVDGDGVVDLLAARPDGFGFKTQGRVEVRGLPSGHVLQLSLSEDIFEEYGDTLVGFGDLDGDAIPDWGAGSLAGYARVYSGRIRAVQAVGGALPGVAGSPALSWSGATTAGGQAELAVASGAPDAAAWIVLGSASLPTPLLGGTLIPAPEAVVPLGLDAHGAARANLTVPASLAGGVLLLQAWIADDAGPAGFSATNALSVLVD